MRDRKNMARLMIKHRMGVKGRPRRQKHKTAETAETAPEEATSAPEERKPKHSVFTVPDSWQPHTRPGSAPVLEASDAKVNTNPGYRKKAAHKRRHNSLNICVSDEESYLIKQFASDQGLSLSDWARRVMFKAMRKPIPDRA
jgi:hypothetical protein